MPLWEILPAAYSIEQTWRYEKGNTCATKLSYLITGLGYVQLCPFTWYYLHRVFAPMLADTFIEFYWFNCNQTLVFGI